MSGEPSLATGRFARTLVLIAVVTAVFLFLAANRLDGELFQIGVVAIGTVGIVTAITAFLIAVASGYD